MNPIVAIITPTKNRLKLLLETINSVQGQSFEEWEHLIIDDGSTDGTIEEAAHRAASDSRIRYAQRNSEKSGANVCRNIGVRNSRAELLVFLDSDDLLAPDCLARRAAVMIANPILDFATFQTGVFERSPGDLGRQFDPNLIGDDLLRFLFFETPWIITAPIWRKSSLIKLGLFDESLPSWQDIDLHIRAIAANLHYLRFPEIDHHVRWQFDPFKTSTAQRRSPEHLREAPRIFEKFEQVVRNGPGMNWSRQRALCSLYFLVAEQWVALENFSAAVRVWNRIITRSLGSHVLHLTGIAVLIVRLLGVPSPSIGERLSNKWKGWMRMRTNAELVHP